MLLNWLHKTQTYQILTDLWTAVKKVTGKKQNLQSSSVFTAEQLNEHYALVSTDRHYSHPALNLDNSREYHTVSEYEVFHKLDKLKPTATGPDGLPAWFIKLSAPIFAEPIAKLINMSLERSVVPSQWKTSIIKPIPKVPHPSALSDYRPISITSVLSRLTERLVIANYIYPAMTTPPPDLTFSNQFAFRPTGSTTVALIYLFDCITTMLIDHPFVRVIALDFSKAFDTVRHDQLISKFNKLSIPSCICNWVADFLSERSHRTLFEGKYSNSLK